ncbi:Fc.00g004550.m01.CDS01 [Cosmosporella sp. VM-42]
MADDDRGQSRCEVMETSELTTKLSLEVDAAAENSQTVESGDEAQPLELPTTTLPEISTEEPLLCRNILSHHCRMRPLDLCEFDSEPEFTSDSETWSDEDEDESDESVLCLTSHGARKLDSTDALRPPLPRRLSFKPLEAVEELPAITKHQEDVTVEAVTPEPLSPIVVAEISPGEAFRNEYFAVSKSGIAGWGAFAAKDLKYGDRILVEKSLFIADWRTLFKEYGKLDRAKQEVAMSLHANELSKLGTPKLHSVWTTNCFATKIGSAGLFPIAARFNHACNPKDNIEYTYNDNDDSNRGGNETQDSGYLEMSVKVDWIPAGQELTISYGRRRPLDLYLTYGFRCQCGACAGLSDKELQALYRRQW